MLIKADVKFNLKKMFLYFNLKKDKEYVRLTKKKKKMSEYLLPKEYAFFSEMTGKRHGLLELDVVICSSVYQIKHLIV